MLTLLMIALLGQPAVAGDPGRFEFDARPIPDLLDMLRTRGPIMGECPLGEVDRRAVPPRHHLLHLGTTGFYLDLQDRLQLTDIQKATLEQIRDDALAAGRGLDAAIERAEHDVWRASSSLRQAAVLEKKIQNAEALRTEQRLVYVRAIRSAADVLTDAQRSALTDK